MSSVLQVEKLSKRFGTLLAVDDISLELAKGEILGLLGPNGAGKTTIFQMLLGVLTPSSGRITYFGQNFKTKRQEILERINFSTAYTNLPWNLRVSDNLAFLVRLYQIAEPSKRLEEVISTFKLQSLLKKEVVKLSAGELTRLNLAKAFINSPEVVLLDEPTASLDPENAAYIRHFILEKRASEGLSVLFTSHNMSEVEQVCDRVVFLHQGKIVANNTPAKLASTLNRSSLSLPIVEAQSEALRALCQRFGLLPEFKNSEVKISMTEERIPDFLSALSENAIDLHGLSVNRASLEDYFLWQSRGEALK